MLRTTQMSWLVTHKHFSSFQPNTHCSLTVPPGFSSPTLISQSQMSHELFWICSFLWHLSSPPTHVWVLFTKQPMQFTVKVTLTAAIFVPCFWYFLALFLYYDTTLFVQIQRHCCCICLLFYCHLIGKLNLAHWFIDFFKQKLINTQHHLPKDCHYWSSSAWHWYISYRVISMLATLPGLYFN